MTYKNKCSEAEYNPDPGARATDLKKCQDDDGMELLYRERYGSAKPDVWSPALELGTSVHNRVLLNENDYAVQKCDGRTKEGKEEKAKAIEAGLRIVKQADFEKIESIVSSALAMYEEEYGSYPYESEWLSEVAVFGEYTGMRLKAKLDSYIHGDIVDLKTISQWPSQGRFLSHIDKYGYAISALHYMTVAQQAGLKVDRYRWLFQESVWPFRSRWVDAPDWLLEGALPVLEKCYMNMARLKDFVAPTEVELQEEAWWTNKYTETVQLEGVEDYAE